MELTLNLRIRAHIGPHFPNHDATLALYLDEIRRASVTVTGGNKKRQIITKANRPVK